MRQTTDIAQADALKGANSERVLVPIQGVGSDSGGCTRCRRMQLRIICGLRSGGRERYTRIANPLDNLLLGLLAARGCNKKSCNSFIILHACNNACIYDTCMSVEAIKQGYYYILLYLDCLIACFIRRYL